MGSLDPLQDAQFCEAVVRFFVVLFGWHFVATCAVVQLNSAGLVDVDEMKSKQQFESARLNVLDAACIVLLSLLSWRNLHLQKPNQCPNNKTLLLEV